MSDLHDLLERQAAGYQPPSDLLERVRGRRHQRARNRRVATVTAAVVVAVAVVGGLANLPTEPDTLLVPTPSHRLEGTWYSTDTDGSSQTLHVRVLDDANGDIVVLDDAATVCNGAPATVTGTAQISDDGIVVPRLGLTCDDGSQPNIDVSQEVDAYALTYDAATNTLTDNFGVRWHRQPGDARVEPTEVGTSTPMWPQSSVDEVRQAQERADAGDPDVTWQVAPALFNDTAPPGDAAIFTRYLQQVVGWDSFRWGDQGVGLVWDATCTGSPGCTRYEIGFVRCGSGPNPLYPANRVSGSVPADADGTTCAPTIDDRTYETVTVVAEQPLQRGPSGIWVVTDSYPGQDMQQTQPRSDAEVAKVLDEFLQARVDGEGADKHVDPSAAEIPLVYAASNGSRYERFEYDLHGPLWPTGFFEVTTRLYADNGNTVVEQEYGLDDAEENRLLLNYQQGTTTENGTPVPIAYSGLDGRVTLSADPAWQEFIFGTGERTYGLYQTDRTGTDAVFAVLDGPVAPTGSCTVDDRRASAQQLAESVRSNPNLSVSDPITVRVGGFDALQLDVAPADGARTCPEDGWLSDPDPVLVLAPRHTRRDQDNGWDRDKTFGFGLNDRMRLYLVDVSGEPASTFAIMVIAPEAEFDKVVEAATPIVDSLVVHAN